MTYTTTNFRTKKALREALKAGQTVRVYEPGVFGPGVPDGEVLLEGPHYPEPHRWYATGVVKNGVLLSVK